MRISMLLGAALVLATGSSAALASGPLAGLILRQKPGGCGEELGAVEKITLQQAFELFTVNGAHQMGNAGKTGSIRKGLLAELLVLDRNPFKIPRTQIPDTQLRMVLINGELVCQGEAP
jgi:predicted amidohydrolase YtcJ